jgi:polar amino acid transport system substrate-binding protein
MPLRLGYLVVAISLAMSLSNPASPAEPLSFGILSAPPYGIERADKTVSGSNHDIAELIAAKAGLTFSYRLEPLARLISDLKAGKLDLMIMIPAGEMMPFAVAEIMPTSTVVLPKPGSSLTQYDDLKGKTLATLRGGNYDPRLTGNEDVKRYEVDSYALGLRMAKAGRVDGMIGPDFGLYYQVKVEGMQRDDFAPPLILNTRTLTLLGSKSITPELAATLKEAVEELRRSGEANAAADKYVN